MVIGKKVKCDYCGKIFLLRFQIGTIDIKFSFSCPECGATIFGYQKIEPKGNLKIINANEIVNEEEPDYYATFSAEFLNTKVNKYISFEDMMKDSVSPFINSTSYIEDYEEYKSIIEKIGIFNSFRYKWPIMKAYYEIFFHNRMKYLVEPLKKISKNFNIKNKLDAMMALHMCTTIRCSLILEEDALTKYSKLGEGIMLSKNNYKIIEFIDYLKLKIDFDKISKKIVDIYSRWINDFEIYLPVVLIELRKNKTKSIDNNNGLYSIYYNVLSFYQDSYELILDMIVFAIGLNNIEERGDYNCFPEKIGVKDFENLYKNTKYNRVNYIKDDEVYSKYIDMDRNIRNSIAHFDYEYDNEKQLFTFNDYNKGNVSHKKISLYEFEIMCYENLKMIMYLNEIFYSIRRISYLDEGLKPNINPSFKNNMLYF